MMANICADSASFAALRVSLAWLYGLSHAGRQRLCGVTPVPGDDDVRRRDGPVWRAQQLDRFIEAGGTLVDTADVYGGGRSEEIIGRWFASRPFDVTEPVVLATKGVCRWMTRRTAPGCPRAT